MCLNVRNNNVGYMQKLKVGYNFRETMDIQVKETGNWPGYIKFM